MAYLKDIPGFVRRLEREGHNTRRRAALAINRGLRDANSAGRKTAAAGMGLKSAAKIKTWRTHRATPANLQGYIEIRKTRFAPADYKYAVQTKRGIEVIAAGKKRLIPGAFIAGRGRFKGRTRRVRKNERILRRGVGTRSRDYSTDRLALATKPGSHRELSLWRMFGTYKAFAGHNVMAVIDSTVRHKVLVEFERLQRVGI